MIVGLLVAYNRDDPVTYVCTGGDEARWGCTYIFYPGDPECAVIPYAPSAEGGEDDTCLYGQCTYFKVWSPMVPYPCMFPPNSATNTWPTIGVEHCIDMISPDYQFTNRLEAYIFCQNTSVPVCVFKDKCAYFNLVTDSTKRAEEEGSLDALVLPSKQEYDDQWKRNVENMMRITESKDSMKGYAQNFYQNAFNKGGHAAENERTYGTTLEYSKPTPDTPANVAAAVAAGARITATRESRSPTKKQGTGRKSDASPGDRFRLGASSTAPPAPPDGGLPLLMNVTANGTISVFQYMANQAVLDCAKSTTCHASYPALPPAPSR